ncbi:MAG TPA: phenylalanine--tRNA ligase subunit beta, partial [Blastocatellia bacterium]|nr:phenylalanine--tRNA ligase subunit beta [Blastocatellia bacterium]
EEHGDDFVLEIDLTSNRPDCLSHLGVAREVAAITGRELHMPQVNFKEAQAKTSDVTSVEILNSDLCPRYSARVIKGVRIGPSPDWLVKRLEVMGQRSVNNVADITNFVMLEFGQPLHAFDLHQLRGERIIVRTAKDGECIITLDGEERELNSQMLVIADAERPIALGGIKGGEDSGITDATVDVLLEAAYFTPAQIRATSRALGLATEASYRFERGTDPEIVTVASDRAAALIAEIAGGEILSGIVDVYPNLIERPRATFHRAKYRVLTGLDVDLGEAEMILRSLGIETEADIEAQAIRAVAPSWRVDVAIEEDLIEEVARIVGYDKVQTTLPGSAGAGAYLDGEAGRRAARLTLTGQGYNEAISFSFVNAESDALFSLASDAERLRLNNPIDETQSHMRTTLLSGLLDAVAHNIHHGTRNVKLFEIGKCFYARNGEERPVEIEKLALAATGARNEDNWTDGAARLDFYDVKGTLESTFENLKLPEIKFTQKTDVSYLHPGRAAVIMLGDREVGLVGQIHPHVASRYKFKQAVYVAELDLNSLLTAEVVSARYRPLPKFPAVARDVSLLITKDVAWAAIEDSIRSLGIPELEAIRIFDLYQGKELPANKHSIALALRYRALDRTLTEAEVNALHERVVETLKDQFSAEIR